MTRRVVVTGLGALTPVGNDAETAWANLIAGVSGAARIRLFDPSVLPIQIAGEVKDFDPGAHLGAKAARYMDRCGQLAVVAARQAVAAAGLDLTPELSEQTGLVFGSVAGEVATGGGYALEFAQRGVKQIGPHLAANMRADTAASQVAVALGLQGPGMAIVSACATGGHCVGEASEMIRRGDAEVMLAGGADATDSPLAFAYFLPLRALADDPECPARACKPFDVRRSGTVVAEGAVVLVLESEEHARRRGARVFAEVAGYGAANDAYHVVGQEPRARGAKRAMQMALRKAGMRPEEVDYVNAHGTGTPMNDAAETLALKDVFGDHAHRLTISSTKSMTGHMMGAAGTVEALVCALACDRGLVPPTINLEQPDPACDLDYTPLVARSLPVTVALSNSLGFGGYSACVVMRRYEAA